MTEGQLGDTLVTALVADAVAAPSMHNAQPWRFRYRRGEQALELWCDPDRAMPKSDPDARNLHIGCGSALFNLRVSAAYRGLTCDVALLPDPEDSRLLASVALAPGPDGPTGPGESTGQSASSRRGAAHATLEELHPQIQERRTSRFPFPEREIPEEVRHGLSAAAEEEGARLVFPRSTHTDFLLDLFRDAEALDFDRPPAEEDVRRWTRLGAEADTAVDGVPEYAFGPAKREGRAPQRDFSASRPVPARENVAFEKTPVLALLSTYGDRPVDWLKAGQALERVLLTATAEGLSTAMTSHALENADLRVFARDPVSGPGYVHMVVRLGHGERGPATPRRPVGDVLVIE